MNDKELLERAARAVGYEILHWEHEEVSAIAVKSESCPCVWHFNSLEWFDQAAELAILRSINVVFLPDRVYAGLTVFEPYTDPKSKRKAYCRAVTRAAAQY